MDGTRGNSGWGLVAFGVTLAIGLITATYLGTTAIERIKLAKSITVKGFAEKRITADLAVWRGTFQVRDGQLVTAYEKLQDHAGKVAAFLQQRGVKKEEINLDAVRTTIQYKKNDKGNATNEIDTYLLSQTVELTTSDVALAARLSREATELIKQGIEFNSAAPQYYCTKLNDLKIGMLAEAAKDARSRAEQLTAGSGSTIGPLRDARQGIFQITPANSTEVSDMGINDTSSIEKKIQAVVTMEYAIR